MALPVELRQPFNQAMEAFAEPEKMSNATRDYLHSMAGRLVAAHTIMTRMGLGPYFILNRQGAGMREHLPETTDALGDDPLVRHINTPYVALLGSKLFSGDVYAPIVTEMKDKIRKASSEDIDASRHDSYIASTGELAAAAKQDKFTAIQTSIMLAGRERRTSEGYVAGFLRTKIVPVTSRATFLIEQPGTPTYSEVHTPMTDDGGGIFSALPNGPVRIHSGTTTTKRYIGGETQIVGSSLPLQVPIHQYVVPVFSTLHFTAQ